MAVIIGVSSVLYSDGLRTVAYAASASAEPLVAQTGRIRDEKFKTEFAYEMAKITSAIITMPATGADTFKKEFAYRTAQVTAAVMPVLPDRQRQEFAYEMSRITTRIISDPQLDIEKAKAEFAYETARLTAKVIAGAANPTDSKGLAADRIDLTAGTAAQADIADRPRENWLRNNADIEPKAAARSVEQQKPDPGYLSAAAYQGLLGDLAQVGNRKDQSAGKVNIDGEIRAHYAANSGFGTLDKDSSGLRLRLGFDTKIADDWRAYAMTEAQKSFVNYNDELSLSRLYVMGKLGEATVTAGSFGYLMADGNIYDSRFKGARVQFGDQVTYTLSHGETDYTKKTTIATARYADFDYNLEAGVYHSESDDGGNGKNTIWTLGGRYSFDDFSVDAMALRSNAQDVKGNDSGYVFGMKFGDLKTYRPGTYELFAKHYNQARGTYIAHGMNGSANQMQGFRGYGLGVNYALAQDFVGGLEYYSLSDKITGKSGGTWWTQVTSYF